MMIWIKKQYEKAMAEFRAQKNPSLYFTKEQLEELGKHYGFLP